ncbi:hypothetical protein MRX96_058812 [Rhipicephalus microplus]
MLNRFLLFTQCLVCSADSVIDSSEFLHPESNQVNHPSSNEFRHVHSSGLSGVIGPIYFSKMQIPNTAMALLEEFVRREGKLSLYVDPLLTFAREELCLHAEDCLLKIRKQIITYQDVRTMVENLIGLHKMASVTRFMNYMLQCA